MSLRSWVLCLGPSISVHPSQSVKIRVLPQPHSGCTKSGTGSTDWGRAFVSSAIVGHFCIATEQLISPGYHLISRLRKDIYAAMKKTTLNANRMAMFHSELVMESPNGTGSSWNFGISSAVKSLVERASLSFRWSCRRWISNG